MNFRLLFLLIVFLFNGLLTVMAQSDQSKFNPEKKMEEKNQQEKQMESVSVIDPASGLPEDFPVYVNTGNPELDAGNYEKAKLLWYSTHPKEAENFISPRNAENKIIVSKEKFDALPQSRKDQILNNPQLYVIY